MNALVTTVKVTEFYCFLAAGNLFSQKKKSLYWLCFWALIVLPLSLLQSKKKNLLIFIWIYSDVFTTDLR